MVRRQKAVGREAPTRATLSPAQAHSIDKLQREIEEILTRAREQAWLLISLEQRRTWQRLASHAPQFGGDPGKQMPPASKRLARLIERTFSALENEVESHTKRLVDQLVEQLGSAFREEIQSRLRWTWRSERRSTSNRRADRDAAAPQCSVRAG